MMLQEHVDTVAGDFNGASWRRPCGSERRLTSIIEETFANTNLPVPPGPPPPLWGPGGVPGEWADVCGFLNPPGSEAEWHVRMHGAFTMPYGTSGLKEKDQSCHHEVWMHLGSSLETSDDQPRGSSHRPSLSAKGNREGRKKLSSKCEASINQHNPSFEHRDRGTDADDAVQGTNTGTEAPTLRPKHQRGLWNICTREATHCGRLRRRGSSRSIRQEHTHRGERSRLLATSPICDGEKQQLPSSVLVTN